MTQWVDVACRHKLQRGRAFEGAEILIAQCRPVVVFGGFNGAALLRARRLRAGRFRLDDEREASTGPRF